MESKLKGIKGVNIANIVLLILVILLAIWWTCFFASFCDYIFNNAELKAQIAALLTSVEGLTVATPQQAVEYMGDGVRWISIAYCIVCGVMIAGSAITVSRASKRPKEIDKVFGWSVAGIVLSIFTGLIITCILYIVSVVLIKKVSH